jgi:predicted RNA-binding protein Jag
MSTTDSIEVSAATVEQAIKDALEQLGAREEDVVIEVLSTPRTGVLGLGSRQAKVRVGRRPELAATSGVQSPPPAPTTRAPSPARSEPATARRGAADRALRAAAACAPPSRRQRGAGSR